MLIAHCSLLTANYSLIMTIVIKYEVYFSGCLKDLCYNHRVCLYFRQPETYF
ncbi:MAG: hypothetical protein IJV35_02970 [Neisseriaceae bacterium]|nr:hypothetical protein [Neisseriaceae bacterium]